MKATRRRLSSALLGLLVVAPLAGCGDDGEPGTPAASAPASVDDAGARTTTTEALTPEEEVEAAYLRSWEVYAEAVRTLDPSGLEEAYADRALEVVAGEIADRAARSRPGLVEVEHDYRIQLISDRKAIVQDEYENHSVLVDPETGDPIEDDPNELIFETYQLELREGRWVVVHFVREAQSPL